MEVIEQQERHENEKRKENNFQIESRKDFFTEKEDHRKQTLQLITEQQNSQNNNQREEHKLEEEKDGSRVDREKDIFKIMIRKIPKQVTFEDIKAALQKRGAPPTVLVVKYRNNAIASWKNVDSKLTLAAFSGLNLGDTTLEVEVFETSLPHNSGLQRQYRWIQKSIQSEKEKGQETNYRHEKQKEMQMQPKKQHIQYNELQQKQESDRVSVNQYVFRILLTWIPKDVLKNQLEEEILRLNVPPVDDVHIGKFRKSKNQFAFFSWHQSDPRLTLDAFGELKLPGTTKPGNSYVQLCDPKVPLPSDNMVIPSCSKGCKKCPRGNAATGNGDESGREKIQLLTGKKFNSMVKKIKPSKVAEQVVIYKPLALTAVKNLINKSLDDLVKIVEVTDEDAAIKTNLCLILKNVFIEKYPELDIEMYGSLAR